MSELRFPVLVKRIPLKVIHADIIRVIIQRAMSDHRSIDRQNVIELDHGDVGIGNGDDPTEGLRGREDTITNS